MKESLLSKVEQLSKIYSEISKYSKFDSSTKYFSALLYALKNINYNHNVVNSIKSDIKQNTGMFSNYRGHSLNLLSNMIYINFGDSKSNVQELLSCDSTLKSKGFKNNSFLPLSSFVLLTLSDETSRDHYADTAFNIYTLMKANHPWITSGDDYPLAVLLASCNKTPSALSERIERIYTAVHAKGLSRGNGLQFLSHLLSFGNNSAEDISTSCMKIYTDLRSNGLKISPSYYASLGLITLISNDSNTIVQDILDMYEYLKSQKESRRLEKNVLIMISSALVTSEFIENALDADITSTTLSISLEALIAAQNAAITAVTSAATIAAISSSSSI